MTLDKKSLDRFSNKILMEPNSGCWLWNGCCDPAGYGRFALFNQSMYAHRIAYSHFKGPIPEGKILDHLCRVRCCVNPDHLEAVTYQVNSQRGEVGLYLKIKTHCKNGHEYTPENTLRQRLRDGNRTRRCRACERERHRLIRERKKNV